MGRYCAEDMKTHTVNKFDTAKEAHEFAFSMSCKFGDFIQVYPEEPEVIQPKATMCEHCGHFPAMEDDFICCECFEQMCIRMGGEDL